MGSFKTHHGPLVPPILSLQCAGPRGHRAALWSVRPESQDVGEACLGAVAGNRTWKREIVKALMSGSATSGPLGRATHKHTVKPLCQTDDKGSGPVLHYTGSIRKAKERPEERTNQEFWQFVGSHVTANLVWRRYGSQGGSSFADVGPSYYQEW